ncbi:hypothetical protein [Mariniphaga sediminis]|jgi:hypothetical protein|nr:hypothetical protein [Mariniphaga sediminis]
MTDSNIESALKQLMQKYEVKGHPRLNLLPGWHFLGKKLNEHDVPLLTWRSNRRFTELQKLVSEQVVEDVSMLRFSSFGSNEEWSLEALMYREFDLCEFISGSNIVSLHAVFSDNSTGNIIVKLASGVIGSMEVGVQAPVGRRLLERHEIIARRGVASDMVVDTQVPQSSVYTFTREGESVYKDVDNELFGLDEFQAEWVRAAFEVQKEPGQSEDLKTRHARLSRLVDTALMSNSGKQKMEVI